MPKYKITDKKTGKSIVVSGDAPPDDATVAEIFQQYNQPSEQPKQQQQRNVPSFTEARFPLAARGIEQAKSGQPIAGGLNLANQFFSEAARPFQTADEALRKVPVVGEPISNILRVPPYLASKAVEYGTSAIGGTGLPSMLNNLLPADGGGQTAEALGTTNQLIAPLLVAPPVMKGVARTPEIIGRATQTTADALSQSGYKIPPSIKATQRKELLGTAQREGIVPTNKGLQKLDARVSELKSAAEALEQTAIANNATKSIPVAEVLKPIDGLVKKWSNSDTPKDFVKVLEGYRTKVLAQQKPELNITELINLKRNLQKQLQDVYVKQMKINPSMKQSLLQEAKGSVESAARAKLEELIPEYADKNSQIHKLLNLKPYVEQAANRISNQDLTTIRLKDVMFGGAGYGGLGSDPVSIATAIVIGRVLTDQRVQSYLGNKIATGARLPQSVGRFVGAAPASTRVMTQLPLNQQDETLGR